MRKYVQVFIKKECLNELKNNNDLLILIQLSRIVNSLRSSLRSYMAVENEDIVIKTKDRFDIILIHGSLLYEAIKALSKHANRFCSLKIWDNISEECKGFNKQLGDKKSFTNTILYKIRNKLFFHFDYSELSDTFQYFDLKEDIRFIIAKTEKNSDCIYSFADDLVLTYLTILNDTSTQGFEKLEVIQKTIIEMSGRICKLCDKILKELIEEKSYKVKKEI